MTEPTKIIDHVGDAIARLSDFLRSKSNVRAMLRSTSSVRTDIADLEGGELLNLTIDGCQIQLTAALEETPAQVAAKFVDLVNGETVSDNLESFEGFEAGQPLEGPGMHGLWGEVTAFPGTPVPEVSDDYARSGSNSVEVVLPASLPALTPFTINKASKTPFIPEPGGTQRVQWYIRLNDAFPGTGAPAGAIAECASFMAILVEGAPLSMLMSLTYSVTTDEFIMTMSDVLSPVIIVASGSISTATINDGAFHEIAFEWEDTGADFRIYLDGVLKGSGPMPSATTVSALAIANTYQNVTASAFPDAKLNYYCDDLTFGILLPCDVEVRASMFDPDDPHFYMQRTNAPGAPLDYVTESEDMSFHSLGVVDQLQELEDTLIDVLGLRGIDSGEGAQLDKIGTIVGLARSVGETDTNYRARLKIQILSNLSNGEPETVIAIVKSFTSSTEVQLDEIFPGHMQVTFDGTILNASELLEAADGAAAGGVSLTMIQEPAHPFVFDGDPEGGGFDDGDFAGTVATI